jgi:hypothetical protein
VFLSVSIESVTSSAFARNVAISINLGADAILDLGFLPQRDRRFRMHSIGYYHIFDGLLASEVDMIESSPAPTGCERPISWAHLGIKNPDRIALTDLLVTDFDPSGFVYLSEPRSTDERDYAYLDASQLERVLDRTRYHIWFDKSDGLYFESLQYRRSLQAGCVPIKVVGDALVIPEDAPFAESLIRESDLIATLRSIRFDERVEKFRSDYLLRPRLEAELSRLLAGLGLRGLPRLSHAACSPHLASSSA